MVFLFRPFMVTNSKTTHRSNDLIAKKKVAATMTTNTQMTERLRTAAVYLEQHGWTQQTEQDDDGHVCLTGAIRYCAPVDGDTYLIREVLQRRDRAEAWNDARGREANDVLTLLRTADIIDQDLADTFGPQWEPIVALVRRAAQLTAQEARQLAATWAAAGAATWAATWAAAVAAAEDAALAAAWDAARAATRAATEAATRAAARAAAWDAAVAAARDSAVAAARDAARAMVVRDRIGHDGFTQAHYDRLTTPWRTVIGPIHPDDIDLFKEDI